MEGVYDYVEGPAFIDEYYSKSYDLHLYVFGDWHVYQSTCGKRKNTIKITDLIDSTIRRNKDKMIDLYLELGRPLLKKHIKKEIDNYIDVIAIKFRHCFYKDKTRCEYSNLRAHYTDFRMYEIEDCGTTLLDYIRMFNTIEGGLLEGFDQGWLDYIGRFRRTLECVLHKLEASSARHIIEAMVDVFDYRNKIKKQKKYVKPSIVAKMLDFFSALIDKEKALGLMSLPGKNYKKELIEMIRRIISYLRKEKTQLNVGKIAEDLSVFATFSTLVLDYYLYMRIFRSYDPKSPHPERAKYALVYAGGYHAENLGEFLTNYLGFKHPFHSRTCVKDNCYQCVNIKALRQPLFH